jgi:uncharacterized protein (DUF2147 family)
VRLAGAGTPLRHIAAAIFFLTVAIPAARGAGEGEPRPRPEPATPVGRWLTEDRGGVIDIAPCGGSLCGRIVGLSEPTGPDGKPKTDNQGRPKCGLTILHDTSQTDPGRWAGHITNPDDGTDWNCVLSVDAERRLRLRGYVLLPVLGQTQVWTPYAGRLGAECRMG